jgi:acetolactate synthase I/II/III large subunit
MAKPAAEMSWMVAAAANLRRDVETALRVAAADVPGPVHVSLPSNLLEAKVEDFERLADAGDPLGPQDLPPTFPIDGPPPRPGVRALAPFPGL